MVKIPNNAGFPAIEMSFTDQDGKEATISSPQSYHKYEQYVIPAGHKLIGFYGYIIDDYDVIERKDRNRIHSIGILTCKE